MTTSSRTPSASPALGRSRRVRIVLVLIVVAMVIVAALVLWYFFFRPAGPPPVGPNAPIIPISSPVA